MFHADQTVLLAWTSESSLGSLRPSPDRNDPHHPAPRASNADHAGLRRMALIVAFTILLFALALAALATGSSASAHAVVAAPPVFCNTSTQTGVAGDAEVAVLREPNRSWMLCVQPHARDTSSWLVRCWIRLWDTIGPLARNFV